MAASWVESVPVVVAGFVVSFATGGSSVVSIWFLLLGLTVDTEIPLSL
jgi:hypothetical protein